jgi:hypothetical protein
MKTVLLVSALGLACSPSESIRQPADPDPVAYQILTGARRALGETERVRTLSAVAHVTGPHGSFETRVYSARDGRARLDLGGQFLGGVGACHGWLVDDAAHRVRPLDRVNRSVVRGHELHMLVLAPETRWKKPQARGIQTWKGQPALALEFQDDLGERVALYLRPSDTLPLGLELVNHTGHGARDVQVTLGEWDNVAGVRLFRHAVFAHGGDRYEYDYTDLQVNPMIETLFEAPRQLAGDPHSHR